MDDLIDSLESTTLAPKTDEDTEYMYVWLTGYSGLPTAHKPYPIRQAKQGRNAQRKLCMKLEASLGPLAKTLPKPRPTRAPDKKKRKPTRSQEAKARRFGRMLRKWTILLPPQNGRL